jgi:thymidylate kinase
MIIVNIDGPNGVGKTTVTEAVMNHMNMLEKVKTDFVHFHRREFPIGQLIQRVLNGELKMDPMTLQMLYSADRLDFSRSQLGRVESSLTKVLIVDRYLTSGLVYGMSDGLNSEVLKDFDKYTVKPNINIILTAPVEVLLKRLQFQKMNAGETGDIYETPDKLARLLRGYELLEKQIPYVRIVNANRPLGSVIKEVIQIINEVREEDGQICSLD